MLSRSPSVFEVLSSSDKSAMMLSSGDVVCRAQRTQRTALYRASRIDGKCEIDDTEVTLERNPKTDGPETTGRVWNIWKTAHSFIHSLDFTPSRI